MWNVQSNSELEVDLVADLEVVLEVVLDDEEDDHQVHQNWILVAIVIGLPNHNQALKFLHHR